uniref:Putative lividomycin production protein n=1 Tax=Streptomyces lividus TaxID=282216 RepID=Q2MF55_STRLV|nr:putative lividomycin production protein [Streptomyces lividus]
MDIDSESTANSSAPATGTGAATALDHTGSPAPGRDRSPDDRHDGHRAAAHPDRRALEARYGTKCARLLLLAADPAYRPVALPVLPLDDAEARAFASRNGTRLSPDGERDHTALVSAYGAYLREQRPGLAAEVRVECGPAPWIVRSSGAEDTAVNVNAGGYDSVVCRSEAELYDTVATVVWSGCTERAVAQQRLADPDHRPGPIPVFVQPLIDAAYEEGAPPAEDELPLLDEDTVTDIAGWLRRLHRTFGEARLDCEWVVETDAGPVSVTSLTEARDGRTEAAGGTAGAAAGEAAGGTAGETDAPGSPAGQLALGFGFAAAQRVDARGNSVAWLAGDAAGSVLWQGAMLRQVRASALRLVQVRPATAFDPEPRVDVLTEDSHRAWEETCSALPAEFLVPPRRIAATAFLAATTLDDAWARYLGLDGPQRERVGHVFVERGSPAEHAGVMFRQAGVAVLRARLDELPGWASYALADPWSRVCFFGDGEPPLLRTVPRRVADVPADARLLFSPDRCADAAGAVREAGRAPTVESMPGADAVRALPGLPPVVKDRVLEQSLLPSSASFRRVRDHGHDRVESPAFLAQLAIRLAGDGQETAARALLDGLPEAARACMRAVLAAQGALSPAEAFPASTAALAHGSADVPGVATVAACADLRPAVALAELDDDPRVTATVRAEAVRMGAALVTAGAPRAAFRLLRVVRRMTDDMDALCVYTPEERERVLLDTLALLPPDAPGRVERWCALLLSSSMPPGEAPRLLGLAAGEDGFAEGYLRLKECESTFTAAAGLGEATERARELNDAYRAFVAGDRWTPGARPLLDLVHSDLVEVYDAALKKILLQLVDRPGPFLYRLYLDVMSAWLDAAGAGGLAADERRAAAVFREWIAKWRAGEPHGDYTIEHFTQPRLVIDLAAAGQGDTVAPDNPHQLHNLLHQWLLSRLERFPVEQAPGRLVELHRFCDRFCRGGNKLLRFTRDSFELEIPLSIHKASLLFRPDRIEVEWSEQPGVEEEETGRLLAFTVLLRRFGDWFPDLVLRADKLLLAGTWTLRIEVRPSGAGRFTYPRMRLALELLRTMLDASFDFSYVENEEVAGIDEAFADDVWKEYFTGLVAYRRELDDSDQYEAVESLPLGTAMAAVCLDGVTRTEVARAVRAGGAATFARMDALWEELAGERTPDAWNALFVRAQQLTLTAAALWPEESAAVLREGGRPWADLLATSLLRRRDVRDRLAAGCDDKAAASLTGLAGALLRHTPAALLRPDAPDSVAAVAAELADRPRVFRRCKQYLVHRYADILATGVLDRLVADLETVPEGFSGVQEEAISAALGRVDGGPRFRAPVRSKVDEAHPLFRAARARSAG